MANVGQTVFRFAGALLLAAGATMVDHPRARSFGSSEVAPNVRVEAPGPASDIRLTPGKRAYSIRVGDPALIGLLRPGNRVDLLTVVDEPSSRGARVARVLASDVRVLAVSIVHSRPAQDILSSRVVTLEVHPDQVSLLAPAAADDRLQLVMRGPNP
jgi:Flp pilus assembly protein CpaB